MNRNLREHISNTDGPICISSAEVEDVLSIFGDWAAEERVLFLRIEDKEAGRVSTLGGI